MKTEYQLTKRQHDILAYILRIKKLKVQDLCIEMKISDKTARNEIKEINQIVNRPLIKSSNTGIEVNLTENRLINDLLLHNEEDENISHKLIKLLLLDEELDKDFDIIADALYISSTTLHKIVKEANKQIARFNLKIIRKKNRLLLSGDDNMKRYLLISMILHDNNSIFGMTEVVDEVFESLNTQFISQTVERIVNDFGFMIPEHFANSFMINIYTIIALPTAPDSKELLLRANTSSIEMQIASQILEALDLKTSLHMQYEIADSLIGIINPNRRNVESLSGIITPEFTKRITYLLKKTFEYFKIDADFENSLLVFINHVYLMLQRSIHNYSSYLFESEISIKDSCLYIYDIALYFCNLVSEEFSAKIADTEVSLIAIHIGYAIEEAYANQDKINIALITENYDLVDNYIINKINSDYYGKVNIIKIKDKLQINNTKTDLFITTISHKSLQLAHHCLITPLLTNTDKSRIQKAILDAIYRKSKEKFNLLVSRYFDRDLFFYNESLCDKDSVLEFLDLKLQRKGIVDDKFLDQIKKRELLSSTCFMREFAIPHPFSCVAFRSKIAVFINPNLIQWNAEDSVQIVFLIAICKDDQLILKDVFDGIANVLCDEVKLLRLKQAKNFDEFFHVIIS